MKNNSFASILLLFIALVVVLLGICYKYVSTASTSTSECDLTASTCYFGIENQRLSVRFVSKPVVEEEIYLALDLPDDAIFTNGWIEGVDMFMGKTPLMSDNGRVVTFLGSCNLDAMEWRLHFTIMKNDRIFHYSAVFSTYR
ncbi:hypothetical protein ISG33_05335 [Glaciecola sp. MH2013]|uniref:hypothetical protein n=1 Tax=Glaciecola sp. MH2013 TaxID=2785524 RepID=UPI00189F2D69|nr:hypothetical protein [Glaciecola sp. MH2013]MBF7072824.1 hypothetical protein [Glaciecola sp. MH2013]